MPGGNDPLILVKLRIEGRFPGQTGRTILHMYVGRLHSQAAEAPSVCRSEGSVWHSVGGLGRSGWKKRFLSPPSGVRKSVMRMSCWEPQVIH